MAFAGSVTLSNAGNSYSSLNQIQSGTLTVTADRALGAAGNTTQLGNPATLVFSNVNYTTPMFLDPSGSNSIIEGIGLATSYGGQINLPGGTVMTPAGGNSFTLSGNFLAGQTFNPGAGSVIIATGIASGVGQVLTMSGAGTLQLNNGSNAYSGGTTLSNGILQVGAGGGLGTGALTISNNATLRSGLAGGVTPNNAFTIAATGGTIGGTNPLTLAGNGTLSAGGTLTVSNTAATTLSGTLSGTGAVTNAGTGTLTLSGNSGAGFTGNTTVNGGVVAVNGTNGSSLVNVTAGTLTGTGTVRNIVATGGTVTPGSVGGTGTLTSTGTADSTFNGATFNANVNAAASDLLSQTANKVNVTGATLNVTTITAGPFGQVYTVINSPGGVTGTFTNAANGAVVNFGGTLYQVNYSATTVTLTHIAPSTAWKGANSALWSDPLNWTNGVPANGYTVIFDTTTSGFAGNAKAFNPVDDVPGLTNITVQINDGSAAGDFNLGGTQALGLSASGITSTVSVGTNATVSDALTLPAAATTFAVNAGSPLVVSGGIGRAHASQAAQIIAAELSSSRSAPTIPRDIWSRTEDSL